MRTAALAALAIVLAGCATAPVVDGSTAINGHELETALNLYGRWDQRVSFEGRPYYVWRRAVLLNGQTYYCELRAEVGYRNTIKSSIVEGYPAACSLFSVRYSTADQVTPKALPKANPATVARAGERNWRPVGSPAASLTASASGQDASARPRAQASDPGGSE